jgi:hypothetical protein
MIYNRLTISKSFVNISVSNGGIMRKIKYSAAPVGVKVEVIEYFSSCMEQVVFSEIFPSYEAAYVYIHFNLR